MVLLRLTADIHEASRGLSATAELPAVTYLFSRQRSRDTSAAVHHKHDASVQLSLIFYRSDRTRGDGRELGG